MPDLRARRGAALAIYGGLIVGSILLGFLIPEWSGVTIRPGNEVEMHRLLMGATLVYVVTAALPFVPGAEIGLMLLATFGGGLAFLVWLAMVGALTLAFVVGSLVPPEWLARGFRAVGLLRAAGMVETLSGLPPEERRDHLLARTERRWLKALLRNRHLAFGLALNLPGNTFLGGGGGLALVAGMSGLFRFWSFLLTVGLAVSPVPLAFALFY